MLHNLQEYILLSFFRFYIGLFVQNSHSVRKPSRIHSIVFFSFLYWFVCIKFPQCKKTFKNKLFSLFSVSILVSSYKIPTVLENLQGYIIIYFFGSFVQNSHSVRKLSRIQYFVFFPFLYWFLCIKFPQCKKTFKNTFYCLFFPFLYWFVCTKFPQC